MTVSEQSSALHEALKYIRTVSSSTRIFLLLAMSISLSKGSKFNKAHAAFENKKYECYHRYQFKTRGDPIMEENHEEIQGDLLIANVGGKDGAHFNLSEEVTDPRVFLKDYKCILGSKSGVKTEKTIKEGHVLLGFTFFELQKHRNASWKTLGLKNLYEAIWDKAVSTQRRCVVTKIEHIERLIKIREDGRLISMTLLTRKGSSEFNVTITSKEKLKTVKFKELDQDPKKSSYNLCYDLRNKSGCLAMSLGFYFSRNLQDQVYNWTKYTPLIEVDKIEFLNRSDERRIENKCITKDDIKRYGMKWAEEWKRRRKTFNPRTEIVRVYLHGRNEAYRSEARRRLLALSNRFDRVRDFQRRTSMTSK